MAPEIKLPRKPDEIIAMMSKLQEDGDYKGAIEAGLNAVRESSYFAGFQKSMVTEAALSLLEKKDITSDIVEEFKRELEFFKP